MNIKTALPILKEMLIVNDKLRFSEQEAIHALLSTYEKQCKLLDDARAQKPVAWKELAKEHLEVAERFFDESAVLRKDNETLRAELTALRARPQAVAEGFVLVPVEPTPEMVMAFMREFYKKEKSFDTAACYRAMLAASQSATGDV